MKNLGQFLLVLLVAAGLCGLPTYFLALWGIGVGFPVVTIFPEYLTEPIAVFPIGGQELKFVNTMPSIILTDIIVLIMAFAASGVAARKLREYNLNPKAVDAAGNDIMAPQKGWHNTFETILSYIYNINLEVVGHKWASKVFPLVMTIFTFVLVANWLHFFPIVDNVGVIHCADPEKGFKGYPVRPLGFSLFGRDVYALENRNFTDPEAGGLFNAGESSPACPEHHAEDEGAEAEGEHEAGAEEAKVAPEDMRYIITPFMRTATTDLSLTLSLAIVAMVSAQVFGVRQNGPGYFFKFFDLPGLSRGPIGYIFLIVSWLEALSEVLKTFSLALRLFGVLFAGTILLFVIQFLIPVGAPVPFFLLEVFLGLLQAFVFAMLTMVFTGVALAGHHGEDHDHEDHGDAHHHS